MGDVGQEVRRLREAKGWSQPKLAVEAGVAVSGVSQIENGKRNPNSGTLLKLAKALDVDVADFFPKGQAPLWSDESVEERHAQWEAAVLRARQLRQHGRTRMAELLASWRERKDRQYLIQMAELLQDAYDAEIAVLENVQVGLDAPAHVDGDDPAWEEYREASHFYGALREMVRGAGLLVEREAVAHEVKAAA